MTNIPTPLYLDWQFWAALAAFLALILSQLPPIYLLVKPRRLDVEVHSRINVLHKVGNPNICLYVTLRNTGGRKLLIRSLRIDLSRDGKPLLTLPVQNYFENPSSTSPVLFVPFTLKPEDSWGHVVNFLNLFDRGTEKSFRESESKLSADIRKKLKERPAGNEELVLAEPELVNPFINFFDKFFIWDTGEYVAQLIIETDHQKVSFSRQYRFMLYESDTRELREQTDDYKFGGGISYNVDNHIGVFVPLFPT